jgi:hypothetical protein
VYAVIPLVALPGIHLVLVELAARDLLYVHILLMAVCLDSNEMGACCSALQLAHSVSASVVGRLVEVPQHLLPAVCDVARRPKVLKVCRLVPLAQEMFPASKRCYLQSVFQCMHETEQIVFWERCEG